MARVLIVEDDPISAELVSIICKAAHHVVTVVSNGLEALMMLDALPFDLVLADMIMPKMDGARLLRVIRASGSGYAKIPVVVLTAKSDAATLQTLKALGADHVLTKPYQKAALHALLERALSDAEYDANTVEIFRSNELRREAGA